MDLVSVTEMPTYLVLNIVTKNAYLEGIYKLTCDNSNVMNLV